MGGLKMLSPSLPAGPYPLDDLSYQHSALDALIKLGHLRLLQLVFL